MSHQFRRVITLSRHALMASYSRLTRAERIALGAAVVRGIVAGATRALIDWIIR